jgi:ornithine cyclodeaminase/alanine dehydrogenase-like protein (mu-crystallin family)
VLGIIGAGHQAYTQILAHAEVFKLETVRIYDKSAEAVKKLIGSMPGYTLIESSLEEAAAADIVCTLTPSRTPVLKKEWIVPGTHINAVGADAAGKEELEPSILKDAVVVVDDLRQAGAAGEINVPVAQGLFKIEDVHATLSELIIGKKQGRTDERRVTVFDSTGIAIEDIATAKLIFEKAKKAGNYTSIDLL